MLDDTTTDTPEETPADDAPAAADDTVAAAADVAEVPASDDAAEADVADMVAEVAASDEAEAAEPSDDADLLAAARKTAGKPGKALRLQATGKRKTAVARVIVTPGKGSFWLNGRELKEYFPRTMHQYDILEPLAYLQAEGAYHVRARLHGGGPSAQAGALRNGIAHALAELDPTVRTQLKHRGFLKVDTRQVERKKAGLKKARKRPQFSKR